MILGGPRETCCSNFRALFHDFPDRSLFPNFVADGIGLSTVIWLRPELLEEGANSGSESFKTFFPTVLAVAYCAKYSLLMLWHAGIKTITFSEPRREAPSSLLRGAQREDPEERQAHLDFIPSLLANGIVIWLGADRFSHFTAALFPPAPPSPLWATTQIAPPVLQASIGTSVALLSLQKNRTISQTLLTVLSELIAVIPLIAAKEMEEQFNWDNPHDDPSSEVQAVGRAGAVTVLTSALFLKAMIQLFISHATNPPRQEAPPSRFSWLKKGVLFTGREVASFALGYGLFKQLRPFYSSFVSPFQTTPPVASSQAEKEVVKKTAALAPRLLSFAPLSKLITNTLSYLWQRVRGAPSLP